jgi:Glycine rich protein
MSLLTLLASSATSSGATLLSGAFSNASYNINGTPYNAVAQTLNTPGDYTLTVNQTTVIGFELWGPAGGSAGVDQNSIGGVGGYAKGMITCQPGTRYIIRVGSGGISGSGQIGQEGGFGGGGLSGGASGKYRAGSGGGLTGVFLNSITHANSVLIAGGGGGSGRFGTDPQDWDGGFGGGVQGLDGGPKNGFGGGAGTQSAGGLVKTNTGRNGATDGGPLTGGKGATSLVTSSGNGGGGSGYYGGAGGSGSYGSGGGGSGYYNPLIVNNAELITAVRPNNVPPKQQDGIWNQTSGVSKTVVVSGDASGHGQCTLYPVTTGPIWITPSNITSETHSIAASSNQLVTYSLASGSTFPPGITINSQGKIIRNSGVVTGTTSFTMNATAADITIPRTFDMTTTANLSTVYTPTSTTRCNFYVSNVEIPNDQVVHYINFAGGRPLKWGYLYIGLTYCTQHYFAPDSAYRDISVNSHKILDNGVVWLAGFTSYSSYILLATGHQPYDYTASGLTNNSQQIGFKWRRNDTVLNVWNYNVDTGVEYYNRGVELTTTLSPRLIIVSKRSTAIVNHSVTGTSLPGFFVQYPALS